jgi:hypothetical protein
MLDSMNPLKAELIGELANRKNFKVGFFKFLDSINLEDAINKT